MKEINIVSVRNKIIGKYFGEWNEETWNEIVKDCDVVEGVEFEYWGKEDEEGKGWVMYGYDGLGVLVCEMGKDGNECMKEYWKMVKGKF